VVAAVEKGCDALQRPRRAIANKAAEAYAHSGLHAATKYKDIELRKELSQRRYVGPCFLAFDYAIPGDKDRLLLAWCRRAAITSDHAAVQQALR
jgi:hypothetical protein